MLGYDQDSTQSDSLLSGAIGRALLYIKRQESLDAITNKIHARILVIKTSSKFSLFSHMKSSSFNGP